MGSSFERSAAGARGDGADARGAAGPGTEPVVEVSGLRKRFGRREALGGIDLCVVRGEILGLAGPNGSGKSTLLKLLAGFLRPTAGRVRILGLDPWRDREAIMARARFAFAPAPLYDGLTPLEHLRGLARLGTGGTTQASIEATLELVGLSERARDRVGTFSLGMRQRMILAQALLPEPELLVLDEPADGLDPLAVLELRGLLARLRAERGVTIVLSSHLLLELEKLVDRLLVLRTGEVLFSGAPGELLGKQAGHRVRVSDPRRAMARLAEVGLATTAAGDGQLHLGPGAPSLERLRTILAPEGIELLEYGALPQSLEAALLACLESDRGERP